MPRAAQGSTARRRGGRPLPNPERGAAARHVTIRMWDDELRLLRRLGEGNVAEGFHRLVMSHISPAQAQSGATPPPREHRSPSSPRTPSRDRAADEWPAEAPPDDW